MKTKNIIPFRYRNRRGKYNAKTSVVDGINFHSMKEANYYAELKMQKRAKLIKKFERQVSFDLCAHNEFGPVRVCSHIVDFFVTMPDGSLEVREVKGFATAVWDLKRKIFEANYPNLPYKVIK